MNSNIIIDNKFIVDSVVTAQNHWRACMRARVCMHARTRVRTEFK